eukprot:7634854-Lingulodinium_polyedra.AAC.1
MAHLRRHAGAGASAACKARLPGPGRLPPAPAVQRPAQPVGSDMICPASGRRDCPGGAGHPGPTAVRRAAGRRIAPAAR